jgi:hypothetical protein
VERDEILDLMGQLKLAGMRAAYDEILDDGIRRQLPMPSHEYFPMLTLWDGLA